MTIYPKPGFHQVVTYQEAPDFGKARTPRVPGEAQQGQAEKDGGDLSSRHSSPPLRCRY